MAKKSGFAKAQASFMKSIRNFEETVAGMAGFDQPEKKTKKTKKAKKSKAKKTKGKKARSR